MNTNFVQDIEKLYEKWGFLNKLENMERHKIKDFILFRHSLCQEEVDELKLAILHNDKEGTVDALIDNLVITIGTLVLLNIDIEKAWNEVLKSNLTKEPGIKKRDFPNPFNFPDVIKPKNFQNPDHTNNTGII